MNELGMGLVGAGAAGGALWYLSQEKKIKNQAFVFVKPHAVTPKCNETVKKGLLAKGIKITSEGNITSDVIDKKKLVDQHYYAIASKASILKPSQLNVPADKFQKAFGVSWADVLSQGRAYNALDACEKLGCTAAEINKAWSDCKKNNKLVKPG